jgi:hypothetical protein
LKLVYSGLVAAAVVIAVVVVVFISTRTATPSPSPAGAPALVNVTISPTLVITFTPDAVKQGTAVFKVKNSSFGSHEFSINGVTTKSIAPNTSLSARVTFKRPAIYTATLADCGYLARCAGNDVPSGAIKVT